jgi:GNAT superfamily N-acetyltransferase
VTKRIYREDPLGLGRKAVRVVCHPDAWRPRLPEILDRMPIPCKRRVYRMDLAEEARDCPLPGGYEVRDVDRELLDDPGVDTRAVRAPMEYGTTVDSFLAGRFACAAIHGGLAVSWCFVNSVVGRAFELGAATREAHRRKGVGSATVAATLRRARERGLAVAGWHCDVRNVPSVRMAEHLEFALHREYDMYLAVGDEKVHDDVTIRWKLGKYV